MKKVLISLMIILSMIACGSEGGNASGSKGSGVGSSNSGTNNDSDDDSASLGGYKDGDTVRFDMNIKTNPSEALELSKGSGNTDLRITILNSETRCEDLGFILQGSSTDDTGERPSGSQYVKNGINCYERDWSKTAQKGNYNLLMLYRR